jgi:hypothetical protein
MRAVVAVMAFVLVVPVVLAAPRFSGVFPHSLPPPSLAPPGERGLGREWGLQCKNCCIVDRYQRKKSKHQRPKNISEKSNDKGFVGQISQRHHPTPAMTDRRDLLGDAALTRPTLRDLIRYKIQDK